MIELRDFIDTCEQICEQICGKQTNRMTAVFIDMLPHVKSVRLKSVANDSKLGRVKCPEDLRQGEMVGR